MFEYFPDNYGWSQSVAIAILVGGNIHEIDEVCRSMKELSAASEEDAQKAWYEGWEMLALRAERLSIDDEEAGHYLSAGRKYLSACAYYILAERHVTNRDPNKRHAYKKVLECFDKGIKMSRISVERVEVPYYDTSMPALFLPVPDGSRAPCLVFFNGGDSMKELLYFAIQKEFQRRGIAVLIIDNPGAGEALRLRDLYLLAESEIPAAAALDYLESRPDVDANKIGVMGLSLGGYHAPRAAAFEKRFKCCISWAAAWDFGSFAASIVSGDSKKTGLAFQLAWMFGKKEPMEALKIAKKMTLDGVTEKITCPFLVVHGENDRFSALSDAEKTLDTAINSSKRELKIFTRADGGVEHCQVDNNLLAIEYISDWAADILGGYPKGI